MKICGVDKSKHGRIPFHVSSRRSFVRIPLDEFVVIVNGASDPHCTILSSRYFEKNRLKKKKDRRNRANIAIGIVLRLIYLPFSSLECVKTCVGYREAFRYVPF